MGSGWILVPLFPTEASDADLELAIVPDGAQVDDGNNFDTTGLVEWEPVCTLGAHAMPHEEHFRELIMLRKAFLTQLQKVKPEFNVCLEVIESRYLHNYGVRQE